METKAVSTVTLLLCLSAVLGAEWFAGFAFPNASVNVIGMTRGAQMLLMLLIVQAFGGGLVSIGLGFSGWFYGFQRGLIWSLAFGAAAFLLFLLLLAAGVNALDWIRAPMPPNVQDIVRLIFIGGILAPVAEEIFFRGVLYGFLRRWGVATALVTTTLLFVLSHSLDQGIPFAQVVGGLVFAVAYEREGNLIVPITIHVSGNTAIFMLSIW
jgi:uncharacterized protein